MQGTSCIGNETLGGRSEVPGPCPVVADKPADGTHSAFSASEAPGRGAPISCLYGTPGVALCRACQCGKPQPASWGRDDNLCASNASTPIYSNIVFAESAGPYTPPNLPEPQCRSARGCLGSKSVMRRPIGPSAEPRRKSQRLGKNVAAQALPADGARFGSREVFGGPGVRDRRVRFSVPDIFSRRKRQGTPPRAPCAFVSVHEAVLWSSLWSFWDRHTRCRRRTP